MRNLLALGNVLTLAGVIILYIVLLVSFQRLFKAGNELVMPMKRRVRNFFIIAITAMVLKLAAVAVEEWLSYEHERAKAK